MSEETHEDPHGSQSGMVFVAIVAALLINGGLAAAMVVATHLKTDAIAESTEGEQITFQCRYIEHGEMVNTEVAASTWQAAEETVCGATFGDVKVPPAMSRAYSFLIADPLGDPVLKSQRESCSCSEDSMPVVLESIAIVQAPKLGVEEKQRGLPRISNLPEETEYNAVNPDIEPEPKPEPKLEPEPEEQPEEPKKKSHDAPDLDKLLTDMNDEARPENQDQERGKRWGAKNGQGEGVGPLYLQKVKAKLDNSLKAPSSIPRTELKALKARFVIKIGKNGRVWDWKWKGSGQSGNVAFDNMVERTLKRFKVGGDLAFPPPPDEYLLQWIPISADGGGVR